MLPVSSISIAANELRTLLSEQIADVDEGSISISHPKEMKADKSVQGLNLFFYRVEFGAHPADVSTENPFYVRLHCLITALGSDVVIPGPGGGNTITGGENDLRLIGEVMRVLHEHPLVPLHNSNQSQPLRLEVVFLPLSLDDLNHVWSTQGETAYRISIAYEFFLVPVPLATPVKKGPKIGSIGVQVQPDLSETPLPSGGFGVRSDSPEVPYVAINTDRRDWSPHLCFLVNDVELHYVLSLPDSAAMDNLSIMLAGAEGAEIQLVWEPWEWDFAVSEGGWGSAVADTITPLAIIPVDNDPALPLSSHVIDPKNIDLRLKQTVSLPFAVPPTENQRRQGVLYAIREWQRPRPQAEPETIILRSNPLLVSIYHEEEA